MGTVDVLRKRDRIVSTVQQSRIKMTKKYGIEVPTPVVGHPISDNLLQAAIDKEMKNVAVAFEILDQGEQAPVGWSKSSGHLVFDVKMDFTRKAR